MLLAWSVLFLAAAERAPVDCADPSLVIKSYDVLQAMCPDAEICCMDPLSEGAFREVLAFRGACPNANVPEVQQAFEDYGQSCRDLCVLGATGTVTAMKAVEVLNTHCAGGTEGGCCADPLTQGAFKEVMQYRSRCAEDSPPQVPTAVETHGPACKDFYCDTAAAAQFGPSFCGIVVESAEEDAKEKARTGPSGGAVAAIVIAVLAALGFGGLAVVLIVRERQGRPLFQQLEDGKPVAGISGDPPPAVGSAAAGSADGNPFPAAGNEGVRI